MGRLGSTVVLDTLEGNGSIRRNLKPHSMTRSRAFWIFLCLGLLLRVWNLPSPLVDAMSTRQAQTADAIRSLIEEPGFQLDSNASWRGTLPARIVQELPVYNLMTQAVYEVIDFAGYPLASPKPGGADPRLIDISGRLVSVAFWGLSFVLLQALWSRYLSPRETFWANGFVVFAPLSVFFGQALMPEMVFMAVTVGFVLSVLRYAESPTLFRFGLVVVLAAFGSVIKFPGFSHLGLLAAVLMWRAHGWKFVLRPIHWVGLAVILVVVKGWSGYITSVNTMYFPYWTSESSLKIFLGKPADRLSLSLYVSVAAYITAFVLSPFGVLLAGIGLFRAFRNRTTDAGVFVLLWCSSLVVYVLVWGPQTAGGQSYYNLPFLVPCAMLVAFGADWLVERFKDRVSPAVVVPVLGLAMVVPMALTSAYLFREDRMFVVAAEWIKANVPEGEPAAVKFSHLPNLGDYMHMPMVPYYAGRRCFILAKGNPEYDRGLGEVRYIVETVADNPDQFRRLIRWIKGGADAPVEPFDEALSAGFVAEPMTASNLRIWTKAVH